MGLPLPPATQYKIQHGQQTGDQDWSRLTPQEIMARQWAAYEGLFTHPLKRDDARGIDHNVLVNRCEPIVSTGVDLLLGDDVTFEVMQEDGETPDEPAQDWLDAALDAQPLGKMPTLAASEINAGVFGHQFINLVPDDPDTAPYPSLAVVNPHQMRLETDPADYRRCLAYDLRWDDFDDQYKPIERRKLVVRDQPSGAWIIHEQTRSNMAAQSALLELPAHLDATGNGWTENTGSPITWQYPWSPIHDGPNMVQPNLYWGKADLRLDLIHLNDVLNFQLSNLNRIIYFDAHPRDVFFGTRATDIEVSPGNAVTIPNANARVERLQMEGDLPAISAHIDRLMESMDEESHIPAMMFGRLRGFPAIPSGVALRVAMQPALLQTGQKRRLREVFYTKLCQHMLELGGYGAGRKIVIHWSELLPVDSYQEAQTAVLYHGLGASRDTLLQRGGFDPDVEEEKREEEDAADAQASAQRFSATGLPDIREQYAQGQMTTDEMEQQVSQAVAKEAQPPSATPTGQPAKGMQPTMR